MDVKIRILVMLLVVIMAHAETRTNNHNRIHLNMMTSSLNTMKIPKVNHHHHKHHVVGNEKRMLELVPREELQQTLQQVKAVENFNDVSGNRKTEDIFGSTLSVVQDWHLVCKQLCGAGLGGSTCGEPQCEEITKSQTKNVTEKAYRLLDSNKDLICSDLCKYQLGGDICKCQIEKPIKMSRTIPSEMSNRNLVCYTFCLHNDITLTGCSLCMKPTTVYLSSPTTAIQNDTLFTETTPSTAKTTTTTTTTTTTVSTTPDWKEVCANLCKTGDGGSLCNCDKPPFF